VAARPSRRCRTVQTSRRRSRYQRRDVTASRDAAAPAGTRASHERVVAVGAGKTTLTRRLLEEFVDPPNERRVLGILNDAGLSARRGRRSRLPLRHAGASSRTWASAVSSPKATRSVRQPLLHRELPSRRALTRGPSMSILASDWQGGAARPRRAGPTSAEDFYPVAAGSPDSLEARPAQPGHRRTEFIDRRRPMRSRS